jgi:hypothetical protein
MLLLEVQQVLDFPANLVVQLVQAQWMLLLPVL